MKKLTMKLKVLPATYIVEDIKTCAFVKGELKFMVKWKGYTNAQNTEEPFSHLKDCIVFHNFISEMEEMHQLEIGVHDKAMQKNLHDEVRNTIKTRDAAQVQKLLEDFTLQEFRCYRALYPTLYEVAGYAEKYIQMYLQYLIRKKLIAIQEKKM